MIDLSIIIVSYNNQDFVEECFDSISKTIKKHSYEVFFVDNASSDRSVEVAQNIITTKNYKNMYVLESKDNLGFSKANNLGVKKAKGRYILFLNPDTVIYPNTIDYLIEFMDKNKDTGACTCKLVMLNGEIDDASHRGFPTPWNSLSYFSGLSKLFPRSKIFSGYNMNWQNMNKMHEIDALAGAFMLVRRKAGEEVGWWDEDYFFYGEDLDFCYNLKLKKWKIMYIPQVSILHYKGVSSGLKKVSREITTASRETKKRVTGWRFEAMRIFYRKNYEKKYPKFVKWLVFGGIALKEKLTLI